jgi:hypothetical protein
MVEQNEWVFFKDIDWDCPNNNQFNIDTRDFHVGYKWNEKPHKDFDTIKKYTDFFFTKNELVELLERYYDGSGGKCNWRFFALKEYGHDWSLKYLRVFRTDLGFLICNSDWKAIKKNILSQEIHQEFLHNH